VAHPFAKLRKGGFLFARLYNLSAKKMHHWMHRHKMRIGSGGNNRECAMFLAGGPDGDFHVLMQSREELHEASDQEVTRAIPHQQGNLKPAHPASPFRSTGHFTCY